MTREAFIQRVTRETDITLSFCLDGGHCRVDTGIGFFDHMLTAFAHHGRFGLEIKTRGDLDVDAHHTVEDTGLVLGQAIREALGDKIGIERFAHSYVPMDEALGFAAVDISGRPFLVFDASMPQSCVGQYDACLTEEFFRSVCVQAGLTLHITGKGHNSHHITEAIFKASARALQTACHVTGSGVSSTKGVL